MLNQHESETRAKGNVKRGKRVIVARVRPDYGRGLREKATEPTEAADDYAKGLREGPEREKEPDYARGLRDKPQKDVDPDYARGLRTKPEEETER